VTQLQEIVDFRLLINTAWRRDGRGLRGLFNQQSKINNQQLPL
jgi:hypothetical protein